MSLSWRRLLRFLRSTEVPLHPADAEESGAAPLVPPGVGVDVTLSQSHAQAGMAQLADAALRASQVAGRPALRVLTQPRGRVDVLASAVSSTRYALHAHDRSVVGIAVVGSVILTLGVDDAYSALKIWRFSGTNGTGGGATNDAGARTGTGTAAGGEGMQCTSTLRFAPDDAPTALAVRARPGGDGTQVVAAGFTDGAVALLRGDVLRERVQRKRIAPAPGEMSESKPVVFLGFIDSDTLFVVTESSIAVIDVGSEKRTVLDTRGADRYELCTLALADTSEALQLCVAREEALYFFTKEGRGPCLAFPTKADGCVASIGRYILHGIGGGEVVAYDIQNRVLAYKGRGDVICVFDDGEGAALICMKDGSMRRLVEVGLKERVGMLLDRELFVAAVSLARSESAAAAANEANGTSAMNELLMRAISRYAEHLIEKNEYDAAAEQLIDTIGYSGGVEPSWVITRLVEQPGLRSGLRLYLERLHASGRAAFVHTKVLITCYRHDRARAAVLPKCTPATHATVDDAHVAAVLENVDWKEKEVDSAISMCRAAGLSRVAESLARGRGRHAALAEVLVDDLDDLPAALTLLSSLQDDEHVTRILSVVARRLLVRTPVRFVEFLANAICKSSVRAASTGSPPRVQLSDYAGLFSDRPRWYAVLLERVLARPGGLPAAEVPAAWLELFEALVCVDVAERVAGGIQTPSIQPADAPASEFDDRRSTHSTLTDFSLSLSVRRAPRAGKRALKILQSRRSMIDLRKALRIAEVHGHDLCLEYLYEYLRMYRELGVCLRENDNGKALLRAARRHGDREPQLWLEALRLFAPRAFEELLALESGLGRSSDSLDTVQPGMLRSSTLDPGNTMKRSGTFDDGGSILSRHTSMYEDGSGTSGGGGTGAGTGAGTNRRNNIAACYSMDALNEVMTALDRSGVLSPLEIVEIVTETCPDAPWVVLSDFLQSSVACMTRRTVQEEFAGVRLAVELQELRKEATQLSEEAVIFRPQSCAACDEAVAVPMMYFFCKHAYHASCLAPSHAVRTGAGGTGPGDGASASAGAAESSGSLGDGMWVEECPKCASEQDEAVSLRQALEERNVKHDEFYALLKSSRDGFATGVEYLERSPFI